MGCSRAVWTVPGLGTQTATQVGIRFSLSLGPVLGRTGKISFDASDDMPNMFVHVCPQVSLGVSYGMSLIMARDGKANN